MAFNSWKHFCIFIKDSFITLVNNWSTNGAVKNEGSSVLLSGGTPLTAFSRTALASASMLLISLILKLIYND